MGCGGCWDCILRFETLDGTEWRRLVRMVYLM